MIRAGMTKDEAVHLFVRELNAIPQGMIAQMMMDHPDEWEEVTAPCGGDRVYVYDREQEGEIVKIYSGKDFDYEVELDDGSRITVLEGDFEMVREDYLPIWGTMWMFDDPTDDWWLEECGGFEAMSQCGFRIYCHPEYGYVFGIDGAGYDFYEAHWTPLYEARGLHWHDPETEGLESSLANFTPY